MNWTTASDPILQGPNYILCIAVIVFIIFCKKNEEQLWFQSEYDKKLGREREERPNGLPQLGIYLLKIVPHYLFLSMRMKK